MILYTSISSNLKGRAMQKLVISVTRWFLLIFIITAILSLIGVAGKWFEFIPGETPYLTWLLSITVAEGSAVIILIAKKGLRYLPDTVSHKTEGKTLEFMSSFISTGSSVSIVTNRASWISRSESLYQDLKNKPQKGISIEIITPKEVVQNCKLNKLKEHGVKFYSTDSSSPPEARFTLINADRAGAERLAIARGVHPDHEVTIFDSNSGPQIIAMAKDIIRKSKESHNAS